MPEIVVFSVKTGQITSRNARSSWSSWDSELDPNSIQLDLWNPNLSWSLTIWTISTPLTQPGAMGDSLASHTWAVALHHTTHTHTLERTTTVKEAGIEASTIRSLRFVFASVEAAYVLSRDVAMLVLTFCTEVSLSLIHISEPTRPY